MRRLSRSLRVVALSGLFAAVLAGVLVSPWALGLVGADGVDWDRASAIGQAYEAASAVLSGLALGGIGLSIALQVRANHQSRIQTVRQMHMDLLKLALDDPLYRPCWGAPNSANIDDRQAMYINLILSYWQARWDIGSSDESVIRAQAIQFFRGEAPRLYWQEYGRARLSGIPERRRRGMTKILDEEYRKAVAAGPPDSPKAPSKTPRPAPQQERTNRSAIAIGELALAGVAAIALGRAWKRMTNKR